MIQQQIPDLPGSHALRRPSDFAFRCREALRFVAAMASSRDGRRIIVAHVVNATLLAGMLVIALVLALFGLFEGLTLRRRTLVLSFSALVVGSALLPLLTMPFFSFKDVFDRCIHKLTRRRLFVSLSKHVFYRPTRDGGLSLHLAKAHALLAEKYQLVSAEPVGRIGNTSRLLGMSLARSIRDAVRRSRRLVLRGWLRPEQRITGATYGYLFGTAGSKLRLKRCQPPWWSRIFSSVFYRYGALHAVFMYFIIHDKLPASFDPVYFIAQVGDLVGDKVA